MVHGQLSIAHVSDQPMFRGEDNTYSVITMVLESVTVIVLPGAYEKVVGDGCKGSAMARTMIAHLTYAVGRVEINHRGGVVRVVQPSLAASNDRENGDGLGELHPGCGNECDDDQKSCNERRDEWRWGIESTRGTERQTFDGDETSVGVWLFRGEGERWGGERRY